MTDTPVLEVLAAVIRITDEDDGDSDPVLSVVIWGGDEPVPFVSYDEAADALDLTTQLLAAMEQHPAFVPEGWEASDRDFAYSALVDGQAALREELPRLEELEDAEGTVEGMLEDFLAEGLFVPQTHGPVDPE